MKRFLVFLRRIARGLERANELKEVEMGLRPPSQYRRDRIPKRKGKVEMGLRPPSQYRRDRIPRKASKVEFSVASVEERNKMWREEHGEESF